MIGLMILGAALLWLVIAVGAGIGARRVTGKRRWQVTVTVIVAWLPFWDVLPGYYLYQRAVREVAGVRIHGTAQAKGYLDLTQTDCNSCWSLLRESPYEFIEIYRTAATGVLYRAEQGAGYYTYRLLPRDDERCRAFDLLPNAEAMRSYYGLRERCLYWTVSQQPVSRYELTSGVDYYGNSEGWWPVELAWRRVVDRASRKAMAESTQVRFFSRISRHIGLPFWTTTSLPSGQHIEFRTEEVLTTR